ncbi:MAG: hypothetical protein K2N63_13580 [Lachnospiraceae bacterium]|nr:hypothetical protein [Lachnospiraceae bacterium]
MYAWWEGLSGALKVLYIIAVPSTLLLLVQTVMIVLGFGENSMDANPSDTSGIGMEGDFSMDGGGDISVDDFDLDLDGATADSDVGAGSEFGTLRLFTLQGIVAFLTTFSWTSICFVKGGMQLMPSLLLGILVGSIMMYAVAKLMQVSGKLAENGTFRIKSTIGESALVYVTIPEKGENGGKVTLTMESGFVELSAVTEGDVPIPAGMTVRITDVVGDTVVVEKV